MKFLMIILRFLKEWCSSAIIQIYLFPSILYCRV